MSEVTQLAAAGGKAVETELKSMDFVVRHSWFEASSAYRPY